MRASFKFFFFFSLNTHAAAHAPHTVTAAHTQSSPHDCRLPGGDGRRPFTSLNFKMLRYALSMVSNGVCSIIANTSTLSELKQHYWTPGLAQAAGHIMFGLRLGYFLRRRHHSRAFSEKLTEKINKGKSPLKFYLNILFKVRKLQSMPKQPLFYLLAL